MENLNVNEPTFLNPVLETAMADYIKSQISLSDNEEAIGIECLKCGSKRNIVAYYHSEKISSTIFESRRTTRITTKGIKVPLCSSCNQELTYWKNKHSSERNAIQDSICGFIVLIAAIVILAIYVPWAVFIPVLLMVLAFVYIGYRRSRKNQPNSPFCYIKFRGSTTYVRPRGEGPWMKYDTWLHSIY
jgi:hypothetical protein